MKQTSFAQVGFAAKKKTTRGEPFLTEMEQVVPPIPLKRMLRMHWPDGHDRQCRGYHRVRTPVAR
ncbi:hypothetical protein [Marinobacter persicus]|uniref:hypothetical protein n=1 Tax=Marinobacter persicus TaxID=930118 RepID=UPI000B84237F|nr:hypothetical protein [Marinobacter persicus]